MSSFLTDVQFAWRLLRRRPAITLVAGFSLVMGITLSAVVFSLLDAATMRSLPVDRPGDLAVVLSQRGEGRNHNFSYPDFLDYRAQQHAFADVVPRLKE